jgi:hypothetical protein
MVTINTRTFLKDEKEDRQRFRAHVIQAIVDREMEQKKGHEYMKFICEVPDSMVDEIFTYNEILDPIERDNNDIENDTEKLFKFCCIAAHQLRTSDKDWKGSKNNVLVEWETGETAYEPMKAIATDEPVICAEYAKKTNLPNTDGWKQFWRIEKSEKKLQQRINHAKLKSYRRDPFRKFGVFVPFNHAQAMELDKENGNMKWQDAEATEEGQLLEYNTFDTRRSGAT